MKLRFFVFLVCALLAAASLAQFKVDPSVVPFVHAKQRALVIGLGEYETLGKLAYSASDAAKVASALRTGFRFPTDSVDLLTDDDKARLTSKDILGRLDSLLKDPTLDKGDLFIFYFSGHGIGTPDGDFLCSPDTTAENASQTGLNVNDVINRLAAKGLRNVVFIADACRSGKENNFGNLLVEIGRKTNIAVLLGSKPGQKSYESPRLKSGVFTHYLLRALSSEKTRTKQGALWFGQAGASLTQSVVDFTTQEFGNAAQTPVVVASPKSDVLLANFDAALGGSAQEPQLTPVARADYLYAQGIEALDKSENEKALDLFKQAFSLDSTHYWAAYHATITLDFMGRPGEREKYCNALKNSPKPYFRALGFVQSDSRSTPLEERIKAVETYWSESPKDSLHAVLIWAKLRTFAPMSVTATFLQKALPSFPEQSRVGAFFRAELAFNSNNYSEALRLYTLAETFPIDSEFLPNSVFLVLRMPLMRLSGQVDGLRDTILKACENPDVSNVIWVAGAMNLRLAGFRDDAILVAKKFLPTRELSDLEVLQVAQSLGVESLSHVDDFKRQVEKEPYSWTKRLLSGIIEAMKTQDLEKIETSLKQANADSDNEVEVLFVAFQIEDAIFEDLSRNLGVPSSNFEQAYGAFRREFFANAYQLGTDFEKWRYLCEIAVRQQRGPQAFKLLQQYNPQFKNESQLDAGLLTALLQIAMSSEDDELAKFAAFHPSLVQPDIDDNALLFYCYEYGLDRTTGLLQKVRALGEVSETLQPMQEALELALTATATDQKKLVEFATTEHGATEGLILSKGIAGLALAKLGLKDEAKYCLDLLSTRRSQVIQSLSFRCTEEYVKMLRAENRHDEADAIVYAVTQYASPIPGTRRLSIGAKPDLKSYAGNYAAKCIYVADQAFRIGNEDKAVPDPLDVVGEASMNLAISPEGKLTGSFSLTKELVLTVNGTVDGLGNLVAVGSTSNVSFDIEGKWVPPAFYKTKAFKAASPAGQFLLFTDRKSKMMSEWFVESESLKFTPQ